MSTGSFHNESFGLILNKWFVWSEMEFSWFFAMRKWNYQTPVVLYHVLMDIYIIFIPFESVNVCSSVWVTLFCRSSNFTFVMRKFHWIPLNSISDQTWWVTPVVKLNNGYTSRSFNIQSIFQSERSKYCSIVCLCYIEFKLNYCFINKEKSILERFRPKIGIEVIIWI